MKCPQCEAQNPEDSRYCFHCATPLPFPDETIILDGKAAFRPREKFKPSGLFAGRYEIVKELGGGGMGQVYKARDKKLNRYVALKFLAPGLSGREEAKSRFIQEAQAASVLDHQNICTIHEIDETPDGHLYIAMAYYEGETLKKKIERGAQGLAEALDAVIQIARGMSKAHGQGIVHRDIKPANVIETGDHVMKIVDFGLAKLASEARLTQTSAVIGTPAYMSPEQALGESVDQRTDLWSLGVVFYELLTGQLPFSGDSEQSILYAIINRPPIPLLDLRSDIPREAEWIILKCLQKKPERRYSSADKLLADLLKLKGTLEKGKEDLAVQKKAETQRETERRLATVLSGEILNVSETLKSLEPEEAALVMNRCFDLLSSIIKKYGSRIDRMTGSSFMAAFGVPQAIEDAPKRAVNTAIELRNSLARFNQDEGLLLPLEIRLGINTGTVIVGARGSDQEYNVLGEAVDLASKFCDLSEKNAVTVGPLTHRYTNNDFEYEALKPVALKGRAEPGPAYRLLSSQGKPYRAHPGAERMIYSDMVGRDKNLDKLMLHVLKAVNGEGSIVSVIGEAGIGKSRLVAELSRRDVMKKVTLLQGRALSFGTNLSFHPVIDILRGWARIEEQDPPSVSSQKLEKAIRNVFPEGATEVYPFIATLMGLKLSGAPAERVKGIVGDALEKLILKNFRDLVVKASLLKPLVLILEDLHWADSTSLDLLESLFRLATSHSILFINVLRPDYDTSERILRTLRSRYPDHSTEIYLEPLNEAECATLIGNLLNTEALPDRIRELIARRAEGNPFFIEEVARSFIDDGIVEIKDGRFRVTDRIDAVEIPESISDIIMARVDKLDEQTKSLLKIASVIGRNFFYKILAEVARSVSEIDDRLEYLKEVQLIKEQKRMQELEYLFKHALSRDAVYDSILVKKKKQLHSEVARAIESVFRTRLPEFYGMLAFHYSRAEEMEKAEEYLFKAGEEALRAAASNEALNYFQDTLELYVKKFGDAADPDKVARLQKNIGLALYYKGHFAEAVEHFDKAVEYWGGGKPKSEMKARLKLLGELLWMLKEIHFPSKRKKRIPGQEENDIVVTRYRKVMALISIDTQRMFTEAVGLFRRVGKYDLTQIEQGLAFLSGLSALFSYSGVSLRIGKKILDYFKPYLPSCDDRTVFAYNFWKLVCEYLTGDWGGKEDFDEPLIEAMVLKGENWNATGYLGMLTFIKAELGDFRMAQKCCRKFTEIAETYEDDSHKARQAIYYTKLLLRSGRLSEALDETARMIPINQKIGQQLAVLFLLGLKANAQFLLGDIAGAEASLKQAEEIVSAEKRISPLMLSSYLSSQCLLNLYRLERSIASGDTPKIRRFRNSAFHYGKAGLKNSRRFAAERTKSLRLMGECLWLSGKQAKAFSWWQRSIKEGERLNARPELFRTYLEVGKCLREGKSRVCQLNGLRAEEYLEKAGRGFAELGMQTGESELDLILGQGKRPYL
jgi:serine/threonine protein kinase/tetratricopeptide (TPR) repeat protein